MRPFGGNVFYREKTFLRQLFFHQRRLAPLVRCAAARLASRRKTIPLFGAVR
jgi:hypothetical protein